MGGLFLDELGVEYVNRWGFGSKIAWIRLVSNTLIELPRFGERSGYGR